VHLLTITILCFRSLTDNSRSEKVDDVEEADEAFGSSDKKPAAFPSTNSSHHVAPKETDE
jgi:hypothetical protein